ncbi:hypothetical protein DYB25_004108 [Aphanomyces astaci]|uniref:Uncharacterized protein n=1 Tax=Aphanomyces astaci TaxID=112090 RepID=A0A397DWG2_APHAT|nr:hypothetical protein DYB25_004108 [Aphanomyces astaci]RHY69511.1 hypothetical protein DYB38_007941 [Aphanomyces astaci]
MLVVAVALHPASSTSSNPATACKTMAESTYDPYAAMDTTGKACVQVTGPGNCSALGLCERKSTCYWPPPVDNREPYFSQAELDAATQWCGKVVPALIFMFFSLVIAGLTAVAWTQNQIMSDGVQGAFQAMDLTFANLNILSSTSETKHVNNF